LAGYAPYFALKEPHFAAKEPYISAQAPGEILKSQPTDEFSVFDGWRKRFVFNRVSAASEAESSS